MRLLVLVSALTLSAAAHAADAPAKAAADAPAKVGDALASVLPAYFTLQTALAGDTLEGVADAAKTLVAKAKEHQHAGLEKAAGAITGKDLAADRKAFKAVSDIVVDAVMRDAAAKAQYTVAHCSMAFDNAGADWVQQDKALKNPYFGASMLACGSVKN